MLPSARPASAPPGHIRYKTSNRTLRAVGAAAPRWGGPARLGACSCSRRHGLRRAGRANSRIPGRNAASRVSSANKTIHSLLRAAGRTVPDVAAEQSGPAAAEQAVGRALCEPCGQAGSRGPADGQADVAVRVHGLSVGTAGKRGELVLLLARAGRLRGSKRCYSTARTASPHALPEAAPVAWRWLQKRCNSPVFTERAVDWSGSWQEQLWKNRCWSLRRRRQRTVHRSSANGRCRSTAAIAANCDTAILS